MANFEIDLLNKIRDSISPILDSIFEVITFIGGQEILILVIVTVYFVFSKKLGQRIAYAIFGSLLINNSLKVIIDRVRPFNNPKATYALDSSVTEHATGQSFPSGHAQNSSVAYSSIALTYKKNYLWIISIVLIVLVALSRVLIGVHYPSDVIVGIILGISLAYFGTKLHIKYEDDFSKQIKLYLITAAIFLPILFIYIGKLKEEYVLYKDIYTIYAFYIGYILAVYIEKKYLDFNEFPTLKFRIIRAIIAVVIVLGLLLGLKVIFPENVIFDMLRYFSLSFIGLGIYPLLFKNNLFKKD